MLEGVREAFAVRPRSSLRPHPAVIHAHVHGRLKRYDRADSIDITVVEADP